jgi:hypothetical protein
MSHVSDSRSPIPRNRVPGTLACLAISLVTMAVAQGQSSPAAALHHGTGYTHSVPYTASVEDALGAAASGQTMPMASYTFTATKDGNPSTDAS